MAKFYGPVGYGVTEETSPGVFTPSVKERFYSGDVIQNNRRFATGISTNDNLEIHNRVSILADPYAMQHFHTILYVKWLGANWKVTSIDVQYPRLILTIGGVYNGETAAAT